MSLPFRVTVLVLVTAALAGCPLDGSSDLRKTLGPFQYLGVDPQLSFNVQKAEFREAEDSYSVPTLNYTVSIKQNNSAFPLPKYQIMMQAEITDSTGVKLDDLSISGEMENGVLSISNIEKLYGPIRKLEASRLPELKVKVETYTWFPMAQFSPYVPKT